ncbi:MULTISPECIES: MFS transporter [unclassified Luteococcus]|uniref:MFS transporter n=1 Tax=unclassified Luteococcus TaxID=2639923 RepID=UPI00313D04E2
MTPLEPPRDGSPAAPPPRPSDAPNLVTAGGWAFLLTAFISRLPSSMVQLGYLMVLNQDGRGLGVGGLAVAAVGLGSAVGAPVVGRLVDRFGPLRVVAGATMVSLLGQVWFLTGLIQHAVSAQLLAAAAVVGAANPQIGPIARSHWSHLAARLGQPRLVSKALGYEGAVDEIGFVIGPVLASVLVSWLGASPAALAMMAMTLVLQGVFVAHLFSARSRWRTSTGAAPGASGHSRAGLAVLWPMLACLGVGILFGATQTTLTALFAARSMPGVTGLVYGCVGVGSGVASLLIGHLSPRFPVWLRVLSGALAMVSGAGLMMLLPGAWLASVVAVLLGVGAGVSLVSSFGWMERIAPRDRVATMMTMLATCLTLGVSGGAAAAGQLVSSPAHGMWPVLGSGLLAGLAAVGMRRGS